MADWLDDLVEREAAQEWEKYEKPDLDLPIEDYGVDEWIGRMNSDWFGPGVIYEPDPDPKRLQLPLEENKKKLKELTERLFGEAA